MKNFLFIYLFITLSIIVNSCDEGFKDESTTITSFSLVLKEVTAVPSLTTDTTPNYTFSSNIAGTSTYGGSCSSSTTNVIQGNNTITLDSLSDGTYSDCTITVDTANSWLINSLTMTSFTIDSTADTLLEVTAVTTPTNDTTPNYTFSTNEAGTLTYGGSCSSSTTSAISGNNTITLDSLSDGTYSDCTITFTNSSANSITMSISSFVIDTTAPTVTQVTAVTTPTKDTTPNYTFSTNEAGTITYGGSCSSGTTSATSGNNAITLVSLSDGTYSNCTITVTDSLGHASSALSVSTFVVDTTPPYVSSFTISPTALKAGDTATVRLVFSEAVASFSSDDDITHPSGTLPAMTSSNNITWTGTFTPTTNTQDNGNIITLANSYTDTAGNTGPAAATSNYEVDTLAPSVSSFTLSDTALKAGDNATVELVFSEAVASFSAADINLDNATGTLPSMTSSDNRTWSGTFTPTADREVASNTLSLTTSSYTDPAGNAGPSETTANYAIDTLVPTISSVTAGWGTYLNATEDDSAGTVTVVTSGVEDNQTVTVTLNSTNYTGTVSDNSTAVTVAASGLQALTDGDNYTLTTNVSDAAGNAATVNTGTSFTYDITTPMISGGVAITSATGIQNNLLNAGDNVSVTATFSKNVPVTGTPQLTLAVGDDNQTATYASSGNGGTTLVFKYTIQAGDNDTNGISIRANALALDNGTIMDLAENNAILTHSVVDNNSSYKVDTTAPSVDNFTLSDTALKIGDNATVTLVFSEAVCTVSSGCSLSQTGGTDFSNADITISNLDNGTPSGTLSTMTSSDNETWIGTFTPTPNTEDNSSTLSLATTYTDLAGNNGPDNQTENFEIDTLAPTVSVAITSAVGIQNSFLNAGDNVSVTATFSERVNVSGSPTLTLVVGDDNRTAEYKSGSGSTRLVFEYMILATGTSGENDPDGISILGDTLALNSGTIRDPAHNNATLTHSAVSDNSSVKVDTTAPSVDNFTISDTEFKIGDNATVTLVFSEVVCGASSGCSLSQTGGTDFSNADITISNLDNGTPSGTLSTMTSSDNETWIGTFTPTPNTEDDNNTLSLATTYTDLAGNNGPDNQTENYEIDTLAPTVSVAITSAEGKQTHGGYGFVNAGDNVSVTATFSEAVIVDNSSGNPTLTLVVGSDNRTATYMFRRQ